MAGSAHPVVGESLSLIRRELTRAWTDFVSTQDAPDVSVRPEIIESWKVCRDQYQVDPGMQRSRLTLTGDELDGKRETDEILQLSRPYLNELRDLLRDTGHVLTYFNSDCAMLECEGEGDVRERLSEINFCPGGNWSESVAGTNGPGTAMARKSSTHVLAAEHFVEAWQKWACYAAPVFDPATGEVAAVIDVTGYREATHPRMLSLLETFVHSIEQDLRYRQLRRDFSILEKYADAASGNIGGLLAVDSRGRILKLNSPAMSLLGLCRHPKSLAEVPAMQNLLASFHGELTKSRPEALERQIDVLVSEKHFTTAAMPVLLDRQIVGAVVVLNACSATGKPARASSVSRATARFTFDHIIGNSPGLRRTVGRARHAAHHDVPVLITGESGTGKEMFAQAIHRASRRASGPFIAVNCGSIPRELLESELFGYVAGAFTGAKSTGSAGKFELASGGTLFLDEVSELSLSGQVALLRVLQEMEVVRVGSSAPIPVDARVIAASNKILSGEVNEGRFRRDLFYRLNVFALDLPALRDRGEDIVLLAEAMLDELRQPAGRLDLRFSPAALDAFRNYPWPGNIRELRNVVQRTVVLCPNAEIGLPDLQEIEPAIVAVSHPADSPEEPAAPGQDLDAILKVLNDCAGNVSEASRRLGLSRMTIYRRMQQNSLQRRAAFQTG